jgi:hypothetical protein
LGNHSIIQVKQLFSPINIKAHDKIDDRLWESRM